jgi:hypothetical protein
VAIDGTTQQFLGKPKDADVCKGPYARCWIDTADGAEIHASKQPRGKCKPFLATFESNEVICEVELDSKGMLTSSSVARLSAAFEEEPAELELLLPQWVREMQPAGGRSESEADPASAACAPEATTVHVPPAASSSDAIAASSTPKPVVFQAGSEVVGAANILTGSRRRRKRQKR